MTTPNLPSLPLLAMHKSHGDAHAKLWESLSGKKPLLFQPLASPCKLLSSVTADIASVCERSPATPLRLHTTARVSNAALHIPLMLGLQLLQHSPQDCSHWVVNKQQFSHQVDFVSRMFCNQKWTIFLTYRNKLCTVQTPSCYPRGCQMGKCWGHNCYWYDF